jgi:hypothetical protein
VHLADFFRAGPKCAPVAPKPVEFTLVARGVTLPNGEKNPAGRFVKAKGSGVLIFVGPDEVLAARIAARRSCVERLREGRAADAPPEMVDPGDVDIDVLYEVLQRALREFDPATGAVGDPIFPTVQNARDLLLVSEADRLMQIHNAYVAEEHPEGAPSKANFR